MITLSPSTSMLYRRRRYADYRCSYQKDSKGRIYEGSGIHHTDNEFVIHDIKVIQGDRGLFIAMPSRLSRDGGYRDIAHPINSTTRDRMQRKILEQYEELPEDMIESVEEMVGSGEI